ncbi:dephospho-CoA kinase [Robbsia sp. KACC 23696]|uniref:dephospho-CoA kinase n=1 Tax=Robbsia sp. KACC 23696 TaxID=3149231 RepID=UPI00325B92A7
MPPPNTTSRAPTAPLRIGLTGGIGSGKTLVSDALAALGAHVIDSDVIARAVTAAGGSAIAPIRATFGADFIGADGALDRTRMRDKVFSDPSARQALEAITHPLIRAAIEEETARVVLRAPAPPYLVFAVPLLVESGQTARYDRILVVDCEPDTQVARVIARSGLAEAQVRAIIASQASREARRDAADDVLLNQDIALDALQAQIETLHRRYLDIARCGSRGRALE